jgi:hypothetical protein
MTSININISNEDLASTSSGSYDPIPKGTYATTIFTAELVPVKNGENAGKPQLKIQLRVSEGQFENRRLFTFVPLYTGKAFWKTKAFFEALGYDLNAGNFEVPDVTELLGKPLGAKVTLVANSVSGEDENNVGGFTGASSSTDELLKGMGAIPTGSVGSPWA